MMKINVTITKPFDDKEKYTVVGDANCSPCTSIAQVYDSLQDAKNAAIGFIERAEEER
jgi:hypothetical protein